MKFCLLVEQSEVIRKIAKSILEGEHFVVVEADNTKTALELFNRGAPDVILLDWQVPGSAQVQGAAGQGAIDFLTQIKPILDAGKMTRVVYCTTEHDSVQIGKAMTAGATDVLMKPFTRQMLLAKLQPRAVAA
jgi:two-component system, chemotaxis family, chemotaxis protein CheY